MKALVLLFFRCLSISVWWCFPTTWQVSVLCVWAAMEHYFTQQMIAGEDREYLDGSSQAQEMRVQFLFSCRSTSGILCSSFIFSKPGFTVVLVLSAPLSQSLHVWLSQIVPACESELQIYVFFSHTSCKASLPLGTATVQIITNNNMFFVKRLNSIIIW